MPKKEAISRKAREIREILESHFWIRELEKETLYIHRVAIGEELCVQYNTNSDFFIWTDERRESCLAFRHPGDGGGASPRTVIALQILAYAIKIENDNASKKGLFGKDYTMPEDVSEEGKKIFNLLKKHFWIKELHCQIDYSRVHDDDEGAGKGVLCIFFAPDADLHITTNKFHPENRESWYMRICNSCATGSSFLVRNALIILAYAMKLDQEERPDH